MPDCFLLPDVLDMLHDPDLWATGQSKIHGVAPFLINRCHQITVQGVTLPTLRALLHLTGYIPDNLSVFAATADRMGHVAMSFARLTIHCCSLTTEQLSPLLCWADYQWLAAAPTPLIACILTVCLLVQTTPDN
ncbi:hypothetical protein AURDEDRAFT_172242 [Auricularia subglabra TFB-10046 SS5]|nr:hypothetical protein AURDEDRAFT_172242 [Auricularia subglabra TFB-10046 SS5]